MVGEHVRNLETSVDILVNGASFFSRADPDYDGGITGCHKLVAASEGLGVDCEIHACGPAMRQLMAASRNSNFYEVNLVHPVVKIPGLFQFMIVIILINLIVLIKMAM